MSDPQPDKLKNRPPRAEPLQPDAPARGDERDDASAASPGQAQGDVPGASQRAEEQADTARKNTEQGYD